VGKTARNEFQLCKAIQTHRRPAPMGSGPQPGGFWWLFAGGGRSPAAFGDFSPEKSHPPAGTAQK